MTIARILFRKLSVFGMLMLATDTKVRLENLPPAVQVAVKGPTG